MTIKRNGDRVILKDEKVACSCCECVYTQEEWQSVTASSPANVFEITKEEFRQYLNGGNWQIDTDWTQNELVTSQTPNCTATGTGSGSLNQYAEGCNHFVQGIASGSTIYTGPCFGNITVNYNYTFYVKLRLGRVGSKFYAHFVALANVSDSDRTSTTANYPSTINFTVEGNSLLAFGTWFPSWERDYADYSNNSTSTLTATFTPSL